MKNPMSGLVDRFRKRGQGGPPIRSSTPSRSAVRSPAPAKKSNNYLAWVVGIFVVLIVCSCLALFWAAMPEPSASPEIASSNATQTVVVELVTRIARETAVKPLAQQTAPAGVRSASTPVAKPNAVAASVDKAASVSPPLANGASTGNTLTSRPTPTSIPDQLVGVQVASQTPEPLQIFILFVKLALVWGIVGGLGFWRSRLLMPMMEEISDEDASFGYSLEPQGRVDTNLRLRLRRRLWVNKIKFWISQESAHRQLHEAVAARVRAFAESLDADHWQGITTFVEQFNEFLEQMRGGVSVEGLVSLEDIDEGTKAAVLDAVRELEEISDSVTWDIVEIMLGDLIADADLSQWNRREEIARQRVEDQRIEDEREKTRREDERKADERVLQTQIATVNAQLAPFRQLLAAGGLQFNDSAALLGFFQSWLSWSNKQRELDLMQARLDFEKSQAGKAPESSVSQQTIASALSNLVEWLGRASPEDLAKALSGRGFTGMALPLSETGQPDAVSRNGRGGNNGS